LRGVQQEAVCPFFRLLEFGNARATVNQNDRTDTFQINTGLRICLETMKGIVEQSDGRIVVLTNKSYELYKGLAVELLTDFGIHLAKVQIDGERTFVEKAGIITMAAALREIDLGHIAEGNNILVCLTGGSGADRDRLFQARYSIKPEKRIRRAS